MARKKQRVFQHIMEDHSYEIIKSQIPKHWVIREFNRPDYGIDLVIELFEKIDDDVSETLGEFIYVQVKSVNKLPVKTETIYSVGNVAKGAWKEDKKTYTNIEVVKYPFDTNSLYTIQSLGGSVPVLLFLVDIHNNEVYFICVNDYIDKILLPQNPNYSKKSSVTLTIPFFNKLSIKDYSNSALKFYGKRAKLLASFSKFSYQKNEIDDIMGYSNFSFRKHQDEFRNDNYLESIEIKTQLLYFISQIEWLDIWDHNDWIVLPEAKKELISVKELLMAENLDWHIIRERVIVLWRTLSYLSYGYEEICREWFLPKMFGLIASYPEKLEIIEEK